jgi:hypothetical protein
VTVNHGTIEIVVPWLEPGDASGAGAMRARPDPLDKVSGEFIG